MTLPSWAKPGHGLIQETASGPCSFRRGFSGSLPKARPNAASTFRAWSQVEEIDQRRVLAFDESDLQLPHEPGHRHPEIVPHHDDALHPPAVALPQGLHQFRVLFFLLGVQPLLELVEDDQHLLARRECPGPGAVPPASRSDPGCRASAGQRFRRPFSRRASVSSAVAST